MSMIVFILFLLIFYIESVSCALPNQTYASTYDTYFARIMYEEVYLYKSPVAVDSYANIYFTLPKTYFVELLSSPNDIFYEVNYLNFTGYVKKEYVQTIVGTPNTPYLTNISFRVYSELSRDLRDEPTTVSGSSSQIAYIPLYSRNLTYYGTIEGETLIDGRTNIWYYCKYSADEDYHGYVYSDFCDELSSISENTESVTYTTSPDFNTEAEEQTALSLSDNTTNIVIAILIVPALIFIFMIIKGSRLSKKEHGSSSEVKDY